MSGPTLNAVLNRAFQVQPPLSSGASATIGLIALAAVVFPGTWQLVRHIQVMAHEGSHSFVGSVVGIKTSGVTLLRTAEGETKLHGTSFLAALAGYLGPSGFGLAAAKLISTRHSVAVLWISLILLAALLVFLRNWFGRFTVVAVMALIFFIARYASVGAETVTAYAIAWLLLLSGVRIVIARRKGSGDAKVLATMTRTWPIVWTLLWLAATSVALVVGGGLLA
jgi:hypothetical protein